MKVTTTQIAEQLGVSRSTVSRALSGYPHVDADLRSRIIAKANELGYQPNQAAQSLARNETLLIGVVLYTLPEQYWIRVLRGVELAAKQLHDYSVVVETVITDITHPQEQIDALHKLVKKGARAIVLAPSTPAIMAGVVDELKQQGVEILLLNSDVPQCGRLCYMGSDYVQAGRLAGELLCRFLGGKGRIASIVYDDTGLMISQKLTGFREEIGGYPQVEMLGPYRFSRTGESVYENTRDMLRVAKPNAIFMTYGEMEEVARAVVDEGLGGKIPLVGYDISSRCLSYLRKRVIYAMIQQEPEQQGMMCVRILHDYLAYGIRPKSSVIHARLDVVTTQNSIYYQTDALSASSYYLI